MQNNCLERLTCLRCTHLHFYETRYKDQCGLGLGCRPFLTIVCAHVHSCGKCRSKPPHHFSLHKFVDNHCNLDHNPVPLDVCMLHSGSERSFPDSVYNDQCLCHSTHHNSVDRKVFRSLNIDKKGLNCTLSHTKYKSVNLRKIYSLELRLGSLRIHLQG